MDLRHYPTVTGLNGITRPYHDPRQPRIDFRPPLARVETAIERDIEFGAEQIRYVVRYCLPDADDEARQRHLAWIKDMGRWIKGKRKLLAEVRAHIEEHGPQ